MEVGIVSCNRVVACGATFHQSCLASRNFDIRERDGCIKCKTTSQFLTKNVDIHHKGERDGSDEVQHHTSKRNNLSSSNDAIFLEKSDDDESVIVLD